MRSTRPPTNCVCGQNRLQFRLVPFWREIGDVQPITADRWRRALGEVAPVDAESLAKSLNALLTVAAQIALHRKQTVLIQRRLGGPTTDD